MPHVPAARISARNPHDERPAGRYVLYWMVAYRRTQSNFALQHAMEIARRLHKPLVVLEALRCDYRWANDRLHRFVIDGIVDNAAAFAGTAVTYLPYLEPSLGAGKGLLDALAGDACAVVTDDYPCFFIPKMIAAAAARVDVRLEAVDSNGILPMRAVSEPFVTAFSFRAYLQRTLRTHLPDWPEQLTFDDLPALDRIDPSISTRWPMATRDQLLSPDALIASLPIDHSVSPVPIRGGARAVTKALRRFVDDALSGYLDDRNQPELSGTSKLSPYLHFGHISSHQIFDALMTHEQWTSRKLAPTSRGAREGWWGLSPGAEAFVDQFITWREVGFNMCATRPDDYFKYSSLPRWVQATLGAHMKDARQYIYTRGEFEHAQTHDVVWNAAERQLTRDGWMHNYLRMLWGKKILEWTPDPEEAIDTMVDVMNKHALDGRDPNSYTGYFWTLGRYDRPWAPERPVYGTIRYMSSDNTVKKLRMKNFLVNYAPPLQLPQGGSHWLDLK